MDGVEMFGPPADPAWTPDPTTVERSRLLRALGKWGDADMAAMHRRSVADPEGFWRNVVDDLGIEFATPFERVLDESAGTPFPKWFVGGRINAFELCAGRHADGPLADKDAVIYEGDSGERRSLTFHQLDADVRRFAANLAKRGVARGDRVVLYAPVVPETTVAFLACAQIGAIIVPAFTGYSAEALAARLRDSEAVALVTADGTTRRGNPVGLKATADEALASLGPKAPTRLVVVLRHLGQTVAMRSGRDVYYDELDPDPEQVATADTESNDPLCIVYTSGTTGKPKGIVHSHGGFAVKAAVDFAYGFDVYADDVVAWISDMGWLVGPMLILGPLQLGATAVFTEGLPNHPSPTRIFEIVARNGVTVQGVAPTAMRAVLASTDDDTDFGDLSSLRVFVSTGEAWDTPTWWWLFEKVGQRRRPIINFSGGTEVGGGLLNAYPFLPMEATAFNGPLPGVDAAVLDQHGRPVVGGVGELAVLNTFPGMTHAFWQDDERYLDTYWSTWESVWRHGDLASVDAHGTWRIHGRSDDTIKVSGRRIGPAEIETALLKDPRIVEAAAIGVPDERRGQHVVAFVVLRQGDVDLDDLVATAEANVGRSFAPRVHVVPTLPKTKNGKIMRRAIRARHLGAPVGDTSALDPTTPLGDIPPLQESGEQ